MNVRYFVVVASIATVMLVTSPAFSGPQGESKTSGEKGICAVGYTQTL